MSAGGLFSQKTMLLETRYYSFQSNAPLNAHLYLYNKAMACKYKKTNNDSLAYYAFKDKLKLLTRNDLSTLNAVVLFYKDSLTGRDLLFDSLMRDLCDHFTQGTTPKSRWQLRATEQVKVFQPFFNKLYWKDIEADNRAWIKATRDQLLKQEQSVVPELERIYQTRLPEGKIVVDLSCYATWAGACSYNDRFTHVIFASTHGSNKGELATEVVFHETSHFLVDKLSHRIAELTKGKSVKQTINLWHNMIFYTTGYVMEHYYAKENKLLFPFYVQMKFEDKFPDFKTTVEACKTYWDPYIKGQGEFDEAVKNITVFVQEKK